MISIKRFLELNPSIKTFKHAKKLLARIKKDRAEGKIISLDQIIKKKKLNQDKPFNRR